jgi:hypothetical protein
MPAATKPAPRTPAGKKSAPRTRGPCTPGLKNDSAALRDCP